MVKTKITIKNLGISQVVKIQQKRFSCCQPNLFKSFPYFGTDHYLKSTTSTPGYFLASKAKVVSGTFTLGEKVFTL